jgi:RHS repeat-associated protein
MINLYKKNNSCQATRFVTYVINNLSKMVILFCMPLLFVNIGFANDGGVKDATISTRLLGSAIVPNATLFNQFVAGNEVSSKISNVIHFSINENAVTLIPQSFDATVVLNIVYGANASSISTLSPVTLKVSYNQLGNTTYTTTPNAYYSLPNAKYVSVTVSSLISTSSNGNSFDPINLLKIENEQSALRYYSIAPNATITTLALTYPAADIVTAVWPFSPATSTILANAAQLEWVWVENPVASPTAAQYAAYFYNATRIDFSSTKQSYNIPMLYDGAGKLFVRVRPVNFLKDGNRQDGVWSNVLERAFAGHETNLNWQATTTFAEEGKSKSVISYFDGTLRSRQTVTKDNQLNTIVSSETMYDLQGRPTIQILPTPGITSIIQYQANLNLFNSQVANTDPAFFFDLTTTPSSLSTLSGTSMYYSHANTTGNPNIPDAGGFPYSVTRFTPDATGRIQEQSGVGANHQIGSAHSTKYYYSQPAQDELDALFGTEVGNETHYSKTMVIDANGQASVSYVDMHGRTIATALVGAAPGQLVSLPSAISTASITKNLVQTSTNIIKNNTKIESVSTLTADAPTNYEFNYTLAPDNFQMPSCSTGVFCFDLLYDLEFEIRNESEENVNAAPINFQFKNYSPLVSVACNAPTYTQKGTSTILPTIIGNKISFTVPLTIGSYSVRKTLSISEESLQKYKVEFEQNRICSTLNQITTAQITILETQTGCNIATPIDKCLACSTILAGTKDDYKDRFLNKLYPSGIIRPTPIPAAILAEIYATYTSELNKCNKVCNNNISQALPTIRDLMLLDMIPYSGQYATKNNKSQVTVTPNTFSKFNIFVGNAAPKPFYKFPIRPDLNCAVLSDCSFYFDEQGQKAVNIHNQDILNPGHTILETITPLNFEHSFQNSWAKSLLPYHPEYKKLIFAETYLISSYNWINAFNNTNTWGDAATYSELIVPGPENKSTYPSGLVDPLFISSTVTPHVAPPNQTVYNTLHDKVNIDYLGGRSMWKIAYGNVICKDIVDVTAKNVCINTSPSTASAVATAIIALPSATRVTSANNIWQNFKGLYAAERNKLVNNFINSQPNVGSVDCQAIADENANLANQPTTEQETLPYRLHFPKDDLQQAQQSGAGSWWPTPGQSNIVIQNNITTLTSTATADNKVSKCSSYIAIWNAQLLDCPAIAALATADKNALLNDISTKMKTVCILSSDDQNLYGASNIPATSSSYATATFKNFEEIIYQAFAAHSPRIEVTNLCNPFAIEWPKPYGKSPSMVEDVSDKIEGCNCQEFEKIKIDATAHSVNVNNLTALNVYLQAKYGETISETLFTALQQCITLRSEVCVTDSNPIYHTNCYPSYKQSNNLLKPNGKLKDSTQQISTLSNNQRISVQFDKLNFDYVNCVDLIKIVNDFLLHNTANGSANECKDAFVKYFNRIYGLQSNYLEIIDIYKKHCCTMPNLCYPDIECTELEMTYDYIVLNFAADLEANCKEAFTAHFNQETNILPALTWDEVKELYLKKCNKVLDICVPKIDWSCDEIDLMITEFIKLNNIKELENCNETFAAYFNERLNVNPRMTWNEIASWYLKKCNKPLLVCLPKIDCDILKVILNEFKNKEINPLSCKSEFILFFNHNRWQDNKVEYTWDEIVAVYKACNFNLDICKKIFNCIILKKVIFDFHSNFQIGFSIENCHTQFINYFNCYFNMNPAITNWSEIETIYREADCGLSKVCILTFDCNKLAIIYNGFKAKYLSQNIQIGSTIEACRDRWEEYFHEQQVLILNMSSTIHLDYWEIRDIYTNSGCPPIDCSPLLTCENLYLLEQEVKAFYGSSPVAEADFRTKLIELYNQYFTANIVANWTELVAVYTDANATPPSFATICHYDYTGTIQLSSSTSIPQFLKCGGGSSAHCLSCNDIVTLSREFKEIFDGTSWAVAPVVKRTTLTQNELAANVVFSKFINYRKGLQYSWLDYLKAVQNANCILYVKIKRTETPPLDPGIGGEVTSGSEIVLDPSYTEILKLQTLLNQPQNVICGASKPLTTPNATPANPCQESHNMAIAIAQNIYNSYVQNRLADFENSYRAKCLSVANAEKFSVSYTSNEYHYTLYYYNQAGNLVKTVPPAGVVKLSATDIATVKTHRANIASNGYTATNYLTPNHRLATTYCYNTLNQVVAQKTPDAGISNFWYDALGRLVISQNAKQIVTSDYSYTLYDLLGRISEVGQAHPATLLTVNEKITDTKLASWLLAAPAVQVTRTKYDINYYEGGSTLAPEKQNNLRNRVSYTAAFNSLSNVGLLEPTVIPGCQYSASFYSYDIHGNVDKLIQNYGTSNNLCGSNNNTMVATPNAYKKITYDYDLISGKVNQVNYQPGYADQFYHKYSYDAENRLTQVFTSHDNICWKNDATYNYYQHGPLQRTILGNQQVQGIDYAYTTQGWLKGVNTTQVNPTTGCFDMGNDGSLTSPSSVAKDVFGFSLNYFNLDYTPIGGTNAFATIATLAPLADGNQMGSNLFNGNISSMLVNIPQLGSAKLYGYQYDQLNRIVGMNAHDGLNATTNSFTPVTLQQYKERVTYDPNGNILTYQRNGDKASSLPMDEMTYAYNVDAQGDIINNKLRHVKDAIADGDYIADIDNQNDGNYEYDPIGNLVIDRNEGIYDPAHPTKPMIIWTVYGKIAQITKIKAGATTVIKYTYDASGNRISKVVTPPSGGATETWYVRDATGNVMSVYEKQPTIASGDLLQTEINLYGSNRLGVFKINRNVQTLTLAATSGIGVYQCYNKFFELSNHLGNVLATIIDRKIGVDATGDGTIDYYEAVVASAQDYYPFGMAMPGRKYTATGGGEYRYGFNGKENDKDISEGGQDYGMRIYDARLGRFLSVDPITDRYPELTPFQFSSNRPIDGIDLDGKEYYSIHIKEFPDGTRTKMYVVNYTNISQMGMTNIKTKNGFGNQGDVGVNYTIHKVDKDGKEISVSGFNIKNTEHGVYAGPNNPKQFWKKPDSDGKYPDDYSLPSIDETDENAKQHDKDFDVFDIDGLSGTLDARSSKANNNFIKRSDKTTEKYLKKENDNITGMPVTKKTSDAGKKAARTGGLGFRSFKFAEFLKTVKIEKPQGP